MDRLFQNQKYNKLGNQMFCQVSTGKREHVSSSGPVTVIGKTLVDKNGLIGGEKAFCVLQLLKVVHVVGTGNNR